MSTRGLVFGGAGRPLEIESLVLDEPRSGEVLVRMVASGVCHSDLHVVDGEWDRPANVVLGHEGAAIVEALGPDVPRDALREGDLVVLAWTAPCGNCKACSRSEPWLCAEPRGSGHRLREEDVRLRRTDGSPIGVYSGIGTFGERQVVAHEAAIPIAPGTPPELAALIGCAVTTGFGAVVNTAGVRAGESVVVIGAGGVGLSAVMGARFANAGMIVVIDPNAEKLELARRAGATHVLQPSEADAAGDLTGGGADHVLEAIGLTETVEQAIELVRPGGTVTLVGMTPQGQRAGIDVYRFVEEGKQLRGSNYGSATPAIDFPRIAALYAEGRLPLDLLVTERIGLEGVEGALVPICAQIIVGNTPLTTPYVYVRIQGMTNCPAVTDNIEEYGTAGSSYARNLFELKDGWRYNLDTSAIERPATFPACYQVQLWLTSTVSGDMGFGGMQAGYFGRHARPLDVTSSSGSRST